MKMYTNKSNAKRAAKKQYGVDAVEGKDYPIGEFTVKKTDTIKGTKTGRVPNIKPNVKNVDKQPTPKKQTTLSPVAFGYKPGTNAAKFGAMLAQDGGTTMSDVIAADWNTARRGYYMTAKELEAKKLIKVDRTVRPTRFTVTKKGLKGMGQPTA